MVHDTHMRRRRRRRRRRVRLITFWL